MTVSLDKATDLEVRARLQKAVEPMRAKVLSACPPLTNKRTRRKTRAQIDKLSSALHP